MQPNAKEAPFEVVFLWKQNDTGLYGRRQEMVVRQLARDRRVRRIWHFDAPIDLRHYLRREALVPNTEFNLAARQLVRRKLGLADAGKLRQNTFLMLDSGKPIFNVLARWLGTAGSWPDYLWRTVRPGPGARLVLWICPIVPDVTEIVQCLQPDLVVADVIDDQREWAATAAERCPLEQAYRTALANSDLAFASSRHVLDGLLAGFPNAHLIPHGADAPSPAPGRQPRDLRRISRPVVGYVGDLDSARLDARLIREVATRRPNWSFVFIGAAHRNANLTHLAALPNVHFLGVRRYERALAYISHFDVAIIPHLDNALTRHMSPLKLSVYLASGVAVVTTPVANLGSWERHVTVADTPSAFVTAIEGCLSDPAQRRVADDLAADLRKNSWAVRVSRMMALVELTLREQPSTHG